MEKYSGGSANLLFESLSSFLRKCMFRILSVGPIPNHIAFIMDGNRRYAKKWNLLEGAGHKAGVLALMSLLKYCYELGVKYVTIYAFSIDNFKRRPEEVQDLMDLMVEQIEGLLKEESIVNQYCLKVYFIGNLKLLSQPVRVAAEKAMRATANNTKAVLLICVAYTSWDEIVHAIQESCKDEIQVSNASSCCNGVTGVEDGEKMNSVFMHDARESWEDELDESQAFEAGRVRSSVIEVVEGIKKKNGMTAKGSYRCDEIQALKPIKTCSCAIGVEESHKKQRECSVIKLVNVEKHMYMAVAPNPEILIRSSGETRLSNFLLWQTANCALYSPAALWPEIGLWHLVSAVLDFQRRHSYLEKKKKQL